MGVGLQPLEFSECLADSPAFRDNLLRHEKELERTSQQIKRLIKEVKDVVNAAKRLGAAQLALADSMQQFEFACIGASMTEDERVISRSLSHFAQLVRTIEEERERMLGRAHEQIIEPLERFRKEHIGAVKESKKKFDKKTAKFCQSQERTLSLSTKKPDNIFQEADAALEMAERDLCQASVEYVFQLQGLQERKKFELVETLLGFVLGWWTFHHTAHDVHVDAEPRVKDLQLRIQRTRSNFEETSKQTQSLMNKMMEMRQLNKDDESCDESGTRAGYLFLLEKKAFGAAWSKQYAVYRRDARALALQPYSQVARAEGGGGGGDTVVLRGARGSVDHDRRHCWEALPADSALPPLQLQALSARGREAWLRALSAAGDGRGGAGRGGAGPAGGDTTALDDHGFTFVRTIIHTLEQRGLHEQGLYRVAGVSSKVARLLRGATDPRQLPTAAQLADPCAWESRTLTSALKGYLRALHEPLATRKLHQPLLQAAKCESVETRVATVTSLVRALPQRNFEMLHMVIRHLCNVVAARAHNLMSVSNVAVCFGPTLLRAERETVASILDLKFYNVLVETLLDHYQAVFLDPPPAAPLDPPDPPNGHLRASPGPISAALRNDINIQSSSSAWGAACVSAAGPAGGAGGAGARYVLHQQQLLTQFPPAPAGPPAPRPPPPTAHALRGAVCSSSSSAESVSSGASPPPAHPAHAAPPAARPLRYTRVRTLYACLGESEGELSFEPNQIVEHVAPSGEPGWLRGVLAGRAGLVPENYVEPLP